MNEMTLECMMNPNLYDKYMEQSQDEKEDFFQKDKEKYKNRIIHTTKLLFESSSKNECINRTFQAYIKECIQSYKLKEQQKRGLPEHPPVHSDISFNCSMHEHNKTITMDKFIKVKKKQRPPLPRVGNNKISP